MREQEARINKLNRDAEDNESDNKEYGVVLLPTIVPIQHPDDEE